jgi:FMN reductase [NAD(P)H]
MTANYETEWHARFGDAAELSEDLPDISWLRQALLRRTHRHYAARPVPEALLRLLLGAAFSASSKSDFQQASVIRVEDRGRRDRLAALVPDMPWIGTAPVFLVFCGDAHRLERIGELRGHTNDNGRLEGFFNAAIDAALVMQTFILAAEAAGLGCCPISAIRNHADAVAEILELPDKVFPIAGLCVGHPAAESFVSMRLPLAVTLHTDRYDDNALAETIDAYDRRRAARYMPPREQQRAAATFGYADFYGWSEDKARHAIAQPEGQTFPAHLRTRGFTFD